MTPLILFIIIAFLAGLYFCIQSTKEGFTDKIEPRCPNLLIQKGRFYYLYNSKIAEVPGVNPVMFNNLEDYVEFLEWQRSQGIRCPVLFVQEMYDAQGNRVYRARPNVLDLQGGLPPSTPSIGANTTVFEKQTPPMPTKQQAEGQQPSPLMGQNPATMPSPNMQLLTKAGGGAGGEGYLMQSPTKLVDATQNDQPYNKNSYPAHDESSYYVGTTTPLDQMDIAQQAQGTSPNPMDPNWGGADFTQSLVDKGFYSGNEVMIAVA